MKKREMLETMFGSLIMAGLKPSTILVALHNVCFQGELLEAVGYNVTDATLQELFDGFDRSIDALCEMED